MSWRPSASRYACASRICPVAAAACFSSSLSVPADQAQMTPAHRDRTGRYEQHFLPARAAAREIFRERGEPVAADVARRFVDEQRGADFHDEPARAGEPVEARRALGPSLRRRVHRLLPSSTLRASSTARARTERTFPSSSTSNAALVQPAGCGDVLAQRGGVPVALLDHHRCAEHGLRDERHRNVARQADAHARIGQRFDDQVDVRRPAAADRGHRVDQPFFHRNAQPDGGEQTLTGGEMPFGGVVPRRQLRSFLARRATACSASRG